jgi:hypothetical protein
MISTTMDPYCIRDSLALLERNRSESVRRPFPRRHAHTGGSDLNTYGSSGVEVISVVEAASKAAIKPPQLIGSSVEQMFRNSFSKIHRVIRPPP